MAKRVLLAAPRGYCAGVDRAVITVEKALALYGAPVYVRKQIVHNVHVVASLEAKGAIFVEETDEVPEGKTVVFSAHGVSPLVHEQAAARNLKTIDATCPLVTKVHMEAKRFAAEDAEILLIGHHGHEEVEGTAGEAVGQVRIVDGLDGARTVQPTPGKKLVWLSQTTLSVDETLDAVAILKERFPEIQDPPSDDICYATQNRQDAVKFMAPQVELVIVVGSKASSNSNRLRELAEKLGVPAYMVDAPEQLQAEWFVGKKRIGLTAGASAPESLAQAIVARIQELGPRQVRSLDGVVEDVTFSLPKNLTHPS